MDTCRWTDSNGSPWTFCDRPCRPGSSWCAEHHARVFQAGTAPGPKMATASGSFGRGILGERSLAAESRRRFNKHTDAKWGL